MASKNGNAGGEQESGAVVFVFGDPRVRRRSVVGGTLSGAYRKTLPARETKDKFKKNR